MIEKGSSIGGMKTPLVLSSVKPPAIKDPSLLADSFRRQNRVNWAYTCTKNRWRRKG